MSPLYRLGCPTWECPDWQGRLYKPTAPAARWLGQYSRVFTTVEEHACLDQIPNRHAIRRWCRETPDDFRFVLSFPRSVTEAAMLQGPLPELDPFLDILSTLQQHDRLGPSLLQLPTQFDRHHFAALQHFLELMPVEFPIAVEPQHPDYFDDGPTQRQLQRLLKRLRLDRVVSVNRVLSTPATEGQPSLKTRRFTWPNPDRSLSTRAHLVLRLWAAELLPAAATQWIDAWAEVVADEIAAGRQPYVFIHATNNRDAPTIAELFHEAVQQLVPEVAAMPRWPGRGMAVQLQLF